MESGRDESERKEGRTQDPGRRRKKEKKRKGKKEDNDREQESVHREQEWSDKEIKNRRETMKLVRGTLPREGRYVSIRSEGMGREKRR